MKYRLIIIAMLLAVCYGLLKLHPIHLEEQSSVFLPLTKALPRAVKAPSIERHKQIFVLLSNLQGDIFDPVFLQTVKDLANNIFYLPGVDRTRLTSIFTVNFNDVTEDGFEAAPVIKEDFKYDQADYADLRKNLLKSTYMGKLVSKDFKNTIISVTLLSSADGAKVTQQIENILPQNKQINIFILGSDPFVQQMRREFGHSLLEVLVSWLVACIFFYILTRKLSSILLLIFRPLTTIVLQLVLYDLSGPAVHPMVFPVLLITWALSLTDTIFSAAHNKKNPIPIYLASIAMVPAISLILLGVPLASELTRMSVAGIIALLLTHPVFFKNIPAMTIYLPSSKQSKPSFYPKRSYLWLWVLLLSALGFASGIFVGNYGSGPPVLRPDTNYQKAQKFATDNFNFSADVITITAIASEAQGCADPAIVNALEEFHWFLSDFPGVHSISSLGDTVKKLNVFYHENYLKWFTIPRETATCIFNTGTIEPRSGLLNNEGLIMPITISLNNHDPQTISKIYNGIKNYKASPLLSFNIAGESAGLEAMINEHLTKVIKNLFLGFFVAILLVGWASWPAPQKMELCFLFCVIWSLTFALIAVTHIGINLDTITAVVLGTCLIFYFLSQREYAKERNVSIVFFLCGVTLIGGVFSQITFIYYTSVIALWMLFWTWLLGFRLSNWR